MAPRIAAREPRRGPATNPTAELATESTAFPDRPDSSTVHKLYQRNATTKRPGQQPFHNTDTKKPSAKEALSEILGNFRKCLYLESTSQNYNEKGSFKTLGEVTEATTRRREGSAQPGPPASANTFLPRRGGSGKPRKATREAARSPLTPAKISRAYQSAAGTPLSPPPPAHLGGTQPRWASGPRRWLGRDATRGQWPRAASRTLAPTPPRGRVAAQPKACSAPALPTGALGGASWGLRAEEVELRGPGGPEESGPAAGVAGAGPLRALGDSCREGGGAHRLLRCQGLQLRRMRGVSKLEGREIQN
uniref:translation initiation factor IF-2-like n=1 Tax=Nyctereutes procyonoides TaxID=34880 RepID=UPI002444E413|nr:translation initiation factor IF-2-like [Nyctereutes procyonoides]